MNFTPQLGLLPEALTDQPSSRRLKRNIVEFRVWSNELKLYDYHRAWQMMHRARPAFSHLPSVFVGWDNSPRRGRRGVIVLRDTPEVFAAALRDAISVVTNRPASQRIVFVNAWNEWAEGNYLEPDQTMGRAYLSAVADVVGVARP